MTYGHGPDGGGVWGAGEAQVVLGDVLAGAHDGAVLPAQAFLGGVGQLDGIDVQHQRLRAQLGLEAGRPVLLLGLPVGIVEVQAGVPTFALLAYSRSSVLCISGKANKLEFF